MPTTFGAYHELFVGGGALFFSLYRQGKLERKRVTLADRNLELITAYRALQEDCEGVIEALQQFRYLKEQFYEVRAWDWRSLQAPLAAARMIYLNRTGFNGLYRVNSKGGFNVPFGRHKKPRICNQENLRAVSKALQGVELLEAPFEEAARRVRRGDFVYCDPPYVPLSSTAFFVAYSQGGFDLEDQERLALSFERLAKKGAKVMLSNSSAPWVTRRYKGKHIHQVLAVRNVNSKVDQRGPVAEVIVTSYPVAASGEEG
jgi:DNA adenine methylase